MTTQVQCILTDIEGTTTSIAFVHDILFPYSRRKIKEFVSRNGDREPLKNCLDNVAKIIFSETGHKANRDEIGKILYEWIDQDRKQTDLKKIQGIMWEKGYQNQDFQGHVYEDVKPNLIKWFNEGKKLAVFSSGSIQAQKLLFGFSQAGDLTHYFSDYFDTTVGSKKELSSYTKIAKQLELNPQNILFLSDVKEELDAAQAAGLQTMQVLRPGIEKANGHTMAKDFFDVSKKLNHTANIGERHL